MKRITSFCILFSLVITPVLADDQKSGPETKKLPDFQKLNASFEQIKHAVQRELSSTETVEKPKEEQAQPVAPQAEKVTASLEQLESDHLDVREDELPKQDKSKTSDSELRVWCGMLGISVFSTFIGAHLQKQTMWPLVRSLDTLDEKLQALRSVHDRQAEQISTLQRDYAALEQRIGERERDQKERAGGGAERDVKNAAAAGQ